MCDIHMSAILFIREINTTRYVTKKTYITYEQTKNDGGRYALISKEWQAEHLTQSDRWRKDTERHLIYVRTIEMVHDYCTTVKRYSKTVRIFVSWDLRYEMMGLRIISGKEQELIIFRIGSQWGDLHCYITRVIFQGRLSDNF